jgi:hypothetical protein
LSISIVPASDVCEIFAMIEDDGGAWRPVNLNVFSFEFIDDGKAEHWLVECVAR